MKDNTYCKDEDFLHSFNTKIFFLNHFFFKFYGQLQLAQSCVLGVVLLIQLTYILHIGNDEFQFIIRDFTHITMLTIPIRFKNTNENKIMRAELLQVFEHLNSITAKWSKIDHLKFFIFLFWLVRHVCIFESHLNWCISWNLRGI